jgi:hypothetical protein
MRREPNKSLQMAVEIIFPFIILVPLEFRKMRRILLFLGLLLYLFDYVSDIYVAIQYWKNNDTWWFWMTLGFIIIPSIIVNMISIIKEVNEWTCITAFLQLSFFVRYIQALKSPKAPRNSKVYFLAKLRYLETITESAPQWCLQVYIMLRQWYFPSYTLISSGLSLASLAWSITTLEEARATIGKRNLKLVETLLFVVWQLFTLVSRLFAIVLFAYVFRYNVFTFLAVHWLLLVVTMFIIQIYNEECFGKSLLLSLLAAFPFLFHASKTVIPTKDPKAEMNVGYIFLLVENIIMVTLSLAIKMPDVPHLNVWQLIAISCIVGGSVLSFIGFKLCWHRMNFSSSPFERYCEHESTDIGQIESAYFSNVTLVACTIKLCVKAKKDHRHNYNTQMYQPSPTLSLRETTSQDEPAEHWSANEKLQTLSSRSLPNPRRDFWHTNETMDYRNNDNTQMHPSQTLSPGRTNTQDELADHSAENKGFFSSMYETTASITTSAYNYAVSFLP